MSVYILMTAMPPTTGHADMIAFADRLGQGYVHVVINTQAGEPYVYERVNALKDFSHNKFQDNVYIHHYPHAIQQEPNGENDTAFWEMWRGILRSYGMTENDVIVASEPYGHKLAEIMGATFIPYDIERSINNARAERIRNDVYWNFHKIMPEFQPHLRTTVTLFGAESVGKTTMLNAMRWKLSSIGLKPALIPEWARGYLEAVGPEITYEKMQRIFMGQRSLQVNATGVRYDNAQVIVQDTDLFSTLGYWELNKHEMIPDCVPPYALPVATEFKSDLYIILSSEIPFKEDQLRYGGDIRETDDQYWIDLCKRHELNYVYVTGSFMEKRETQVVDSILSIIPRTIPYVREGAQYEH